MGANDANGPLAKPKTHIVLPSHIVQMGRDVYQKVTVNPARKHVQEKFARYYHVVRTAAASSPYYRKPKEFDAAIVEVGYAIAVAEAKAEAESVSHLTIEIAETNDTEELLGTTPPASVEAYSSSVFAEDDASEQEPGLCLEEHSVVSSAISRSRSPEIDDTAIVSAAITPVPSPGLYNHGRVLRSSVRSNAHAVPASHEMNDPKPDPDRQENPVGPASSDSAGHGKNAEEHPAGSLNTMGNTARKVRAGTVTAIFNFALRRGPGPDGQPQIDPDAHDQTGIHHGPQAHSPARVREEGALDAVGAMNGADHPDSQNQVGQIRNKKRSFGVDGGEAIPARKRRRRSDNDESRQNRLRLVGLRQANRRQEGLRQAGRPHNGRHGGTSEVSRQSGSSGSAEVMGQERAAGESSNDYFATGRPRTKRGSRC